jgi:hypothetical protein
MAQTLLSVPHPPEQVLKSSLDRIGEAKNIRVRAVVMSDEVVATGQKLQRSSDGIIKIRRPNGFRVDTVADRYRRTIQYDGTTLALYDPDRKFYATYAAPATIDATVADVKKKLGLDLPLSQLFAENAYETLKAQRVATYVGLHRVQGVTCHHLAFSQDNVDWQIWIGESDRLPRKIVIDFKTRPGRPQYVAELSDWNLNAQFPAAEFTFTPPPGAEKIDFLANESVSK